MARSIEEAVEACQFGRATAAKRGRNPRWPWVPIVDHGKVKIGVHQTYTEQIKGRAFETRQAAVACAQRVIDFRRDLFRQQLLTPRFRAVRAQWDVEASPEELVGTL